MQGDVQLNKITDSDVTRGAGNYTRNRKYGTIVGGTNYFAVSQTIEFWDMSSAR